MERKISSSELANHNSEKSCWVAVEGKVYDVTPFLSDHPGGKQTLINQAGKDATKQFKMFHGPTVLKAYGSKFLIGTLVAEEPQQKAPEAKPTAPSKPWPPVAEVVPSKEQSWKSGGTAGELPAERAKATFNVEAMTNVLDGGPEGTKRRRWLLAPLKPIETHLKFDMDRHELISKHIEEFIGIHKSFIENGYLPLAGDVAWMAANATNTGPLMPHMSLFLATIRGQASMEQQMWWLPRALNFKMIGSYAQTELGHGSNVRGLQTTAHYDPKTQEFILNTPTLQSMKWWNSNIGVCATHAAVFAQLILEGKEYGVHVFMVQLRDENHRMLPGIEAGDVGPKLGDHAIDTGYLRLSNVRIPREYLFSKRQHVSAGGKYIKHSEGEKGGEKLHYLTMMSARSGMISISGGKLAIAATVAVRFSCVRRQGFVAGGDQVSYKSLERQVIDYSVQRFRLFKQVATAYAIKFTGAWMNQRFHTVSEAIANGEPVPDDIVEIHASSAGLKGLCTYLAAEGIEDCRKACGGHGYLLNSGVAALAADYVWQTTAEGDFVVMLLQTARFLLKCVSQAKARQALPGLTSYMAPLGKTDKFTPLIPRVSSAAHFRSLPHLRTLFEQRALVDCVEAEEGVNAALKAGASLTDAFNECAPLMVRAARAHCSFFMLDKFIEIVTQTKDADVKRVLTSLCAFFACAEIQEGHGWVGLLDRSQTLLCARAVHDLLTELRPDAVAIVDAFDIPDNVLNSTIGRYDGNVYEALYAGALRSKLNLEQPFSGYVHLRPHLDLELLALRNKPTPEALESRKEEEEREKAKASKARL